MDENLKNIIQEKDKRISHLEKLNHDLSGQLAQGFFQTVSILESILMFTEVGYENSHVRFVSEKSEALAKLLGLKNDLIFEIKMAGLLCTLGKLSFKDSALHTKFPHEMTKGEYQQYVLYPRIGVEILSHHKAFSNISKLILQHQERLDGTGFPNNLKDEDIHPGAKILAVVDTYHNLVYKKAREQARQEKKTTYTNTRSMLAASKDRHVGACKYLETKRKFWFDARVVDVFIVMINHERSDLSDKQILRVPVNKIEPGMIFAQDYHSSYGLLIASRGEKCTKEMINPLIRFAENEEIPHKLLMLA